MARTVKKKKELTLEEKLEQALVPTNEYEYQIPNNWRWVILGNLVGIKRGASPRPIKKYITDDENGINWIKIGDTDSGKYVTQVKEKVTREGANKSVFVERGTLLLSNSMSFGRPYILNVDGCIHDGWLAITPTLAFDKEYLYYGLLASEWYFERVAVGTAVRNLNSDRVAATPIPLPPLPEQQRIVDRIESLFAKLDEAKEKAQAVVDGFENRKAAILHKAFTGELTEGWRTSCGIDRDWQKTIVGDHILLLSGQDFKPELYNSDNNGIPYITGASNFDQNHVIINRWTNSPTVIAQKNDVLLVCKGSGYGKTIIADFDEAHIARQIMALRVKPSVINTFLCYFLQSENEYLRRNGQGLIPGISRKVVLSMIISLPDVMEQKRIVDIIRVLFKKEQQAKEAAEQVISQIDTMKKSILARAFRGELGTNDPADESAVELLKRVL